ncbi:Co2+/Mg2+ efflux protein ApaG [Plesiomonas shigelloides]|uniref:Co2+/Mg2+ efflux protein ApaG n=1 Tax=Plesiomonas shigelloides TaxID=703 RepID=UPI001E4B8EC1|nr:Co2+/Mg2+ efflux protein ApaG [Plesiomonas shigelloides]MDT1010781.1 Co2+/Mg2+ efflux protein ApaG [Plesiomonas shigelloides]
MQEPTEQARVAVSVEVQPAYVEAQSAPELARFVFTYTVTLHNQSALTLQLRRRYWLLTDANGQQTDIEGEGVVGEQPVLAPGSCYRYTSGTVLPTPVGTLQGYYLMSTPDGHTYQVPIPVFRLAIPHLIQ